LEALTQRSVKQQFQDKILYLVVFVIWFFLPIISIFLIFALWIYEKKPSRLKDALFILWLALTYGLVAYTGQSIGADETDIARYQFYYTVIADIKTINAFLVFMAVDGGSNPVFYLINFLFSRIFPENSQVHILFWITVTYFFTILGANKALLLLGKPLPSKHSKILILLFLIGIIPFFTVTEIIKQCASVSIVFFAVIKRLLNERRSLTFFILALLVHTSSLMFLPVYFLYANRGCRKYLYIILIGCILFSFLNFNVVLTSILSLLPGGALLATAKEYQNVEVWSISVRHYATFFMYVLLVLVVFFDAWMTRRLAIKEEYSKDRWNVFMVLFLTLMVLLINRGNVHNFVRYVYGLFPFYIFIIIVILKSQIKKNQKYGIAFIAICFFTFSNFKLLMVQTSTESNYANSYFDNSIGNLLTSNVYEFLSFRVK